MQIYSTAFFDHIHQGYQQFWLRVYELRMNPNECNNLDGNNTTFLGSL